ncbi:hypothetical protein ABIB00_003274 [Bradyrhizobium sp. LB14.3]
MGDLYPFSLQQKIAVITENSPYCSGADNASSNPWGMAIIPMEMLSVLFQYRSKSDRCRRRDQPSACSPIRRSGW